MHYSKFLPLVIISTMITMVGQAQRSNDINQSLQCRVEYTGGSEAVVSWLAKADATEYTVDLRRAGRGSFINLGTTTDTFYMISDLDLTYSYEVRVSKAGGQAATGYITLSQEYLAPAIDRKLLIIVASSIYDSIAMDVEAYREVLLGERWRSEVMVVADTMPVVDVKSYIVSANTADSLTAILLLGHIPVPYAGNNAIDGHTPDHRGAWVADVYYGDLDGAWTDTFVDNTEANRDANDNVPGDGKFDQNSIPSDVELAVGRVDMSNLPAFAASEVALTKAYLAKNMAYRTGEFKATRRAIVDNNFNLAEGFAQGAIKSFSGFFDLDSISYENYDQAYERDYLWTYGAGGGNYRGASGITNTNGLAADSLQTVFTNVFGSYFGDWDIENNFLRAALASGTTLINAWSGRPVWYWHSMAAGATVGDCTLQSQNNRVDYNSTFGKRLTHVSLIGDPTLKMYYEMPVEALSGITTDTSVELSWTPHPDADLYLVYDMPRSGEIVRLTALPIASTSFDVPCPSPGLHTYFVAPVVLEISPSGSYYNEGAGAMIDIQVLDNPPLAAFSIIDMGSTISLQNNSERARTYLWDFGDGTTSTVENPMTHTYTAPGTYSITLVASTACSSDTTQVMVTILSTSTKESEQGGVTLYPNPVVDEYVYLQGFTGRARYALHDIGGRQIHSGVISGDGRVSTLGLQAGMYMLTVEVIGTGQTTLLRLVKG